MKILVCFKILPEPEKVLEEDWDSFSLSTDLGYAGLDFNCFDRSALETGLKIREQAAVQGAEVSCTALTIARSIPPTLLPGLYAVGFDEVMCLPLSQREFRPRDVAGLIASAAADMGADIIICGAAAGMAESGMVPYFTAEKLNFPLVPQVEEGSFSDGNICLRCRDEQGLWEKTVTMPQVLVLGNSPELLRMATLRKRMQCRGREAVMLPEAKLPPAPEPRFERPAAGRKCRMTAQDEAAELILKKLTQAAGIKEEKPEGSGEIPKIRGISVLKVQNPGKYAQNGRELCEAFRQLRPELVILEDSPRGRALAAELGEKTGIACFFNGSVRRISEGEIHLTKRACGSNLIWQERLRLPAVITCPPGETEKFPEAMELILPDIEDNPPWLLGERLIEGCEKTDLKRASAVIICGSGMGSRENCLRARLLAEKTGAGFGLTRPAALNAWGSPMEIVGQSGALISPDCCLILGAAGAGAFAVGTEGAKEIISVNTDPGALIFKNSDLGVIADAPSFVDSLLELI